MSKSKHHSNVLVLIFSILIILSSLTVVNPPLETVDAESTRGEENTWYVDDDAPEGGDGSLEKPYQKIQDAVNVSENGDTVRVFAGTYHENVRVNKSLNLFGDGSEDTVINGSYNGDVVTITSDYVNLSGFMITGSGNVPNAGIHIQSDHNLICENNCSNDGVGVGIYLEKSDNNKLMNNTFSKSENGIYLSNGCKYNTIVHNIVNSNSESGIHLNNADHNNISDNTVSSNVGHGIYLHTGSNYNFLSFNRVSKNDYGIHFRESMRNTLTNNDVSNNRFGIYPIDSDHNTIVDNTANDNTYDGIRVLNNGDYTTIVGNTVMNNARYGIAITNSDMCTISNNIAKGSELGISVFHSDENTITDNFVSTSNNGIRLYSSDNNTMTGNTADSNIFGVYIYKRSGDNKITDNMVSNNIEYGIRFSDTSKENEIINNTVIGNKIGISSLINSTDNIAYNNNIYKNTEYGINASSDSIINATNNWWGDASGPYHPVNNSAGKGDRVTDYVEFDPWLSQERFRTIFVTKSGNDALGNGTLENPFLTIQKTVDESNDWDTIRVFEGVYEENIVVDKNVEIIGNGSGETIIDGMGNIDDEGNTIKCSYKGGYGGLYRDVAYDGEYLYATHVQGLSIFDVSDPSNPEEIGFIHTTGAARGVVVSGVYTYVADGSNGLVIVNISDPVNPTIKGHYDTVSSAQGVTVSGGYAYVADSGNGLVIIDISDPENPTEEGHYDTAGSAYGVAVSGGYAYVADGYKSFVIVDISDPENPTEEGHYDTAGYAYGVAVSGGYAYVADLDYGLEIIDISDPENPMEEGHYDTAGGSYDVAVSDDYAYVADYNNGLVIIDISNPGNPTEEGHYDTVGSAKDVAVNGGYAYIANENKGIMIVDISDPENPMEEGHYDTAGYAQGVAVSGGYTYVADGSNGLVIIDINDPGNPTMEGHYDTAGSTVSVMVSGGYAYVADGNKGLVIVDISDPGNPQYEGSYDTAGSARDISVSGGHAYVADGSNGLVIVDISDPENPTEEGHYDTEGYAYGVAVVEDYAYVADGSNGLVIVDINDPENPTEEGHYDTAGSAYGVAVSGDYAYVADGSNDLVIIDISDPRNPTEEGHYNNGSRAYGVAVSRKYAYVADSGNGFVILELHFSPDAALHVSADNVRVTDITVRNGIRTGVLVDADNVEIEICKVTGNNVGIRAINGSESVEISNCDIIENRGQGINTWNNEYKTVTAIDNWWGHPSGPYHSIMNPNGKGNKVSNDVDFDPWLSRPIDFRILHVSPDGNDTIGNGDQGNPYRTIQRAIDMAQDWDTIEVAPGTYSGSITVDKRNVTVIGESPDTSILDSDGAVITVTITADNVVLNGFTINNGNDNGILMRDSSGNRIINCVFPDNSYDLNLSNSKNNQIINTTFETVNFNDAFSDISVFWPIDLKVTDNRSGFIPNAHVKITDALGAKEFDGYTDEEGIISQIKILDFTQNRTSRTEFNPSTISIWKDGHLNFAEEYSINSFILLTCQLQTHFLPEAIISDELMRYVDMDSKIFFDGTESTGRSINYYWEFGDTRSSFSPTPSHTYTSPGVYQVNLTVTDDYTNTSMVSIFVIVENVDPTAQANADMNSGYEDQAIQFDASNSLDTPSDIISFHWDFGDGTQSSYVTPTHAYQNEGEYEVKLTVMDMFGGESTTTIYITVTNIEPWIIEANVTGMQNPEKTLYFTVTADDTSMDIPSLQYIWDFGDGTFGYEQNITHIFQKAGLFNVTITLTDNNGASDSTEIPITITDPEITTSVSTTSIFQDEKVFFDANHELDDGSFVYTWYFGDGTTVDWNETSHTYEKSGIFSPYLIIDNRIENVTIFLEEIVVNNVIPTPRIVTDKHQIREDESLLFDASRSVDSTSDVEHLSYFWDFGNGSKGSGMDVTHAFAEDGSYTVVLTVSDGKSTNSTHVVIQVVNLRPTANAGTPKEQKATVGNPVILDASQSLDSKSDFSELNFTWRIGDNTIYGEIVSHTFVVSGSFSVVLEVRDDNGAVNEDTLTFEVTKSLESGDDQVMNSLNWIFVVIIIVILVVVGYLIFWIRDDELIIKMIADQTGEEEAIVVEGEMKDDEFKPKDEVQEVTVEVSEDQDAVIVDAEVEEVGEKEKSDVMFKPLDDGQEVTGEAAVDEDKKM